MNNVRRNRFNHKGPQVYMDGCQHPPVGLRWRLSALGLCTRLRTRLCTWIHMLLRAQLRLFEVGAAHYPSTIFQMAK